MAEINGVKMTDEQFMLIMELGKILQDEGYESDNGELEVDKIKSERGRKIVSRLEEIANSTESAEK